jgi:nucleoside-diphosphate-sugar epimerase
MRIVVIGGTGHIGSYLTPRLVDAGHTVTCVSRGLKQPYREHPAWSAIRYIELDRPAEEASGNFGHRIRQADPEAVVDLTCFDLGSAQHLVESLRGSNAHLLHCGTIWIHGHSVEVPTSEEQPRQPLGDYGIRKAAIEAYLLKEAADQRFPVTLLHPGHLVGPGWAPVNPAGNFNTDVFSTLLRGEPLTLPNIGMETVHHVHADDVAQAFEHSIYRREAALGHSFHVVSPAALTLRGFAEQIAASFGTPARLQFLPFGDWRGDVSDKDAAATWDHIAHSPNCSIAKARTLLNYEPRYSSIDAVRESLDWLIQNKLVTRALA